ncbi:hypothetical protein ABPG75_006209 [Micractinium tetrahymenae]
MLESHCCRVQLQLKLKDHRFSTGNLHLPAHPLAALLHPSMLRHMLRPAVMHLHNTTAASAHAAWSPRVQQRCTAAAPTGGSEPNTASSSKSSSGKASSSALQPQAAVPSQAAAAAAAPQPPPKPRQAFSFCRMCGGPVELALPEGDTLWRHQCTRCGYIDYQNPRLVVGCIVQHEGRILLCRRGIEPQRGLWTVPAGYLECGESTAAGAARETWEEAGAHVEIDAPYCTWDIPGISQVYVLFRGRLAAPYTFAAREPESLEAALFEPEAIPWDQLAFSSVSIALRSYIADLASGTFRVHHGAIQKRPGSGPNEAGSFTLEDHIQMPTTLPSH